MRELMTKMRGLLSRTGKTVSRFDLGVLVALASFLNIYKIWDLGYGNSYYAAALKSMQTSFSNFFFLSFDSTGFISVDKAPLSLWLDAIFAKILGFSGVAILLPHALAGVLVAILVYVIVKKVAGKLPAFFAGLAITLSPVNVAVYRNNTPDALLLVFVLLAILFIMGYFSDKKIKFLILSAVMIGLGFNTKMMQAYLVLPALLLSIFLFSSESWLKRIRSVVVFIIVTAAISTIWVTIVDLTPASLRPYVGGSSNNSAWNLALAYNGTQRLLGESSVGGTSGFNVGEKGLTRLFTGEMGTQSGWLLGTGLVFSLYFIVKSFRKLWAKFWGKPVEISLYEMLTLTSIVFLVTGYGFFSYASFFHSYYLNIFAIPVAFLFGCTLYELQRGEFRNKLIILTLFVSIPVQIYLISQAAYAVWLIPVILAVGCPVLAILLFSNSRLVSFVGSVVLVLDLMLTPLIWSGYTTLYGNTATAIFIGGPSVSGGQSNRMGPGDGGGGGGTPPEGGPMGDGGEFTPRNDPGGVFDKKDVGTDATEYLKANYDGEKYFVAVSSQQQGSSFILDDGITNIMTLGGFSGRDQAITLSALQEKITNGEIRFFLLSGQGGGMGGGGGQDGGGYGGDGTGGGMFNANEEITQWVQSTCVSVSEVSGLYDCQDV